LGGTFRFDLAETRVLGSDPSYQADGVMVWIFIAGFALRKAINDGLRRTFSAARFLTTFLARNEAQPKTCT